MNEWIHGMQQCEFPMIVIYDHPSDFPDAFVARLFNLQSPTSMSTSAPTLKELYQSLPIHGMVPMRRDPNDDPNIVETWV